MKTPLQRRTFIKSVGALPLVFSAGSISAFGLPGRDHAADSSCRLKIGLNAYSFNEPLTTGTMTIGDMMKFCAENCIDAVDLTGYYFSGYPKTPPDEYLYDIRRKAFRMGLEISGTGIRNNFTDPDERKRRTDIEQIRNWIDVASKIGAPVIRVFAGEPSGEDFNWDQIAMRMVPELKECIAYGKSRGVMVAIQNHNDFIKTAEQAKKIIEMVDSEWFGLILDTGSYRTGDPYKEIETSIPFAVNWQVKEKVFIGGKEVDTDFKKLFGIIKSSSYRGYLPLETLGAGDPKVKLQAMLEKVRTAMND